jgi:hypothetical protein
MRINSSIVYHRLPHKKLVVMKEEQQRDREWDERMAREVLPAKCLELKKIQAENQKLKKELDERR